MKIFKRVVQVLAGVLLVAYLGWAWVANTKSEYTSTKQADSDVILIGTEGTYEPFSYYDSHNKLVGYDVDVARAVFKKLGRKIQFVDAPWDSMLAAFNSGKTDVVFNQVGLTPERLKKYAMTKPYGYSHAVLVVAKDNTTINGFSDLKGKRGAQSLTSNYADMAKTFGATLVSTDGFSKSADLITQGRADATLNDDVAYYSYLKHKPNAALKIVTTQKTGMGSGAMFHKKDKKLAAQVTKAIEELRADGTLTKISVKYFGKDISKE